MATLLYQYIQLLQLKQLFLKRLQNMIMFCIVGLLLSNNEEKDKRTILML